MPFSHVVIWGLCIVVGADVMWGNFEKHGVGFLTFLTGALGVFALGLCFTALVTKSTRTAWLASISSTACAGSDVAIQNFLAGQNIAVMFGRAAMTSLVGAGLIVAIRAYEARRQRKS
jgi:peptidoglycan/LPS O-acetylase OafA/YrhL